MAGEHERLVVIEGGLTHGSLAILIKGRTVGSGIEVESVYNVQEADERMGRLSRAVVSPVTGKSDEEDFYLKYGDRVVMYSRNRKSVEFHRRGMVALVDPEEYDQLLEWVVRGNR